MNGGEIPLPFSTKIESENGTADSPPGEEAFEIICSTTMREGHVKRTEIGDLSLRGPAW
jgi:hypothetical protein